ncbi:MAG TPA: DUF86 domain-containing protein [Chitinophagales bacterium]|mgnify:FL=1|jgi:uncharacterized protein with HEPN domain|nr:DUF86 domain-containing protein [Chitinophagales bacterium]MBP6155207.1 DUF86 domain-containing protein [Chitinophagales bacterium]HQV78004.1 DUF86 domain-containing protein [Chitinophagales bacterium]HQW78726.1 DUF86 domain-containing protein [Chitinophagales bacterium]HRB92840.1 DUF86 domain-containing protein [Chitinophagales bacterium]
MSKNILYLLRILQHIGKVQYINAKFNSLDDLFESNEQTEFDAILIHLTQIVENASKLDQEIKIIYDSVQWQKIKDFRNLIVLEYTGINKQAVFDILKIDLITLKVYIEEIIINEINLENQYRTALQKLSTNAFYKFVDFNKILEK